MNMWCHLPTSFRRRHVLLHLAIVSVIVALTTTLIFAYAAHAVAATSKTINFQGRLLTSAGAVVPDGRYNMQFKIYQDGAGNAAGNPGGTLQWTESYVNNNANAGVEVKNGFFSVSLGSVTPFGSSVDWSQDTLWLSMNVAGSAAACTTFGTAPCAADGEMMPMKRISATPFAINAEQLGGKKAESFLQIAQGVQTDASTNTSSIFLNKTGSGNLIQLQSGATDVFTVGNTGNITLGSNANKSISIATAAADTAGSNLSVAAGAGGSGDGSAGGTLNLQGGAAGGTNGNGGDVVIDAGAGSGTGSGGNITIGSTHASSITIGSLDQAAQQTITIGGNNTAGSSSNVTIGAGSSADSGSTTIRAKNSVTIETNGQTRATFSDDSNTVHFGNGVSASAPNDFTIQGTNSSADAVNGGSLVIQGGSATAGDANGGNITLGGGSGSGTGVSGLVVMKTPTFATVTDDTNCYATGALVATSCTVAASSIDSSAAVMVGFSTTGQTATLPDPTIKTAGRVVYVMAAGNSQPFTLSANGGGNGNEVAMRANTATTMMWNGTDWVVAGTSSASALQDLRGENGTLNVQVGNKNDSTLTLFTVDRASSAPSVTDENAMLGSMYYDTTLDKMQCYEADGWGSCGASPDNFVTISPEYTNAVMNGTDIGTITSDLCSDTLNINDGSSAQPTICGTNETFNFYKWTTGETTEQTRSIYVTYQLPSTFKKFVPGSTSLMGRTDSDDSKVSYQIYRDDNDNGLTSCGSAVDVSMGTKTTWQKGTAENNSDPADCEFEAGDSILFRINLSAKDNANAYVSNLAFTFNNN